MEWKDYLCKILHKLKYSILFPVLFIPSKWWEAVFHGRVMKYFIRSVIALSKGERMILLLLVVVAVVVILRSCRVYSFDENGDKTYMGSVLLQERMGDALAYGWCIYLPERMLSNAVTNRFCLEMGKMFYRKWEGNDLLIEGKGVRQREIIHLGMKLYVEKKR